MGTLGRHSLRRLTSSVRALARTNRAIVVVLRKSREPAALLVGDAPAGLVGSSEYCGGRKRDRFADPGCDF
jgi:hypothetical protein